MSPITITTTTSSSSHNHNHRPVIVPNPAVSVRPGTIWSFWEGDPPEVVLRCFESIRSHNPTRDVIVLSRATLPKFLNDETDYPTFHGRPGTPDDFSKVQYLADWVRLTLLEKYGGVWLDASVICTSSVDRWIDEEGNNSSDVIHMFPMHANPNIHGNWAMASSEPGNPVVKAWRHEMNAIFDQVGPGGVPTEYIDQVMKDLPEVRDRWNNPTPPPLPYLWVYLALQVVLHRQPELHNSIVLHSCVDGPMYRRYQYNIIQGISDGQTVSQKTADDLATKPLDLEGPDKWFIKLVGTDRGPVQEHLDRQTYTPDSGLGKLKHHRARTIVYGSNLRTLANLDKVKAAVHTIVAIRAFGYDAALVAADDDDDEEEEVATRTSSMRRSVSSQKSSIRRSILLDFEFADSLDDVEEEEDEEEEEKKGEDEEQGDLASRRHSTRPSSSLRRRSILVGFNTSHLSLYDEPPKAVKRESISLDFYMDPSEEAEDNNNTDEQTSANEDDDDDEQPEKRESIYSDAPGFTPELITIL